MTTIIGIFDNDSDLEVALNRLYDKGFNDLRVVDPGQSHETRPEVPAATFMPGASVSNTASTSAGGLSPAALLVPGFVGVNNERLNSSYVTENLNIPLTDEEADFYANTLR